MKKLWLFVLFGVFFCLSCSSSDTSVDGDIDNTDDDKSSGESEISDSEEVAENETKEAKEAKERPTYTNDDKLRLNHLQVKGTHNSYHKFMEEPQPIFGSDLDTLDVQLEEQGVRQFELDLHFVEGKGWTVFHAPILDEATNCEQFTDCLQAIKDWSELNPGHHTIFIFVEPKDDFDPIKLPTKIDEVDPLILSVWPKDRIIMPDDVRKNHKTLREAVTKDGWPTLGEGRDKVMFFWFDSGENRTAYLEKHPNAEGRVMFPRSKDIESDYGVFANFDHPKTEADKIKEFAEAGFLVRTRTDAQSSEAINDDYSRIDAALKTAAHFISTDYPRKGDIYEYWFDMPDGNPTRCNPIMAPANCTPEDIENLPK